VEGGEVGGGGYPAEERVYPAEELQAAVRQNPRPWRDGTGACHLFFCYLYHCCWGGAGVVVRGGIDIDTANTGTEGGGTVHVARACVACGFARGAGHFLILYYIVLRLSYASAAAFPTFPSPPTDTYPGPSDLPVKGFAVPEPMCRRNRRPASRTARCGDGAAVGGLGSPMCPHCLSLCPHIVVSSFFPFSHPCLPLLPFFNHPGPSDPPVKGLQYQTLCAGEIEALLAGQRGVVMVQLWVGWDAAAPQPVHNCLVLHGLRRALARQDVSIFMSSAPGDMFCLRCLCSKRLLWCTTSLECADKNQLLGGLCLDLPDLDAALFIPTACGHQHNHEQRTRQAVNADMCARRPMGDPGWRVLQGVLFELPVSF
jgi:hypothetical protein